MNLKNLLIEHYGEDLSRSKDIEELDITNIGSIPNLTELDKEYLEKFEGLSSLCMAKLGLESFKNFPKLNSVFLLNLNMNKLKTGLEDIVKNMPNISELELEYNKFKDISELEALKELKGLTSITLYGNPIAKIPNYREAIFKLLPNVMTIDEYSRDGKDHILDLIQNGDNSDKFDDDLTRINLSPELLKEIYKDCKEEEELDKGIELEGFCSSSDCDNESEEDEPKRKEKRLN